MTRDEALRLFEENLVLAPHTLRGGEAIEDLVRWDSLPIMAIMAMADRDFGRTLTVDQVAGCRTIAELLELLGVASS
jgi:hypothetical protein